MSATQPDTLARLRAANPAQAQADLGRSPVAQATLRDILDSPTPKPDRSLLDRLRRRIPGRGVAVVLATVVVGGGAAIAATDPFGWWSANPDTARFAVNPAVHVRTPTAALVSCGSATGNRLVCGPHGAGQRYALRGTVQLPGPLDLFTRAHLTKAIAHEQAAHRISSADAARFRRELAQVPDSFFAEMRVAMRYQTIGSSYEMMGSSKELVPPPGVPEFLVCEDAGPALQCQNLNGDQHAPIGAGIYVAQPAPDWRPAPARRRDSGLAPGISFTRAELRLLIDLAKGVGTSSSGSRTHVAPAPSRGPG